MTFAPPDVLQALVIPDHPKTYQRRAPLDDLWVLKRDVELGYDRGLVGVPQTVHFIVPPGSREMFPMDTRLQEFFMSLTPDFPRDKLPQICDAFFIKGSKFYDGSPKYPGYLGFGGDTVRCIGRESGMLKIEAVNPSNLPSASGFTSYQDYVIGSKLKLPLTTVNGIKTNRFPHNDGKDLFGMLLSDVGYLLIESNRCRKVMTPEYPYR